MIGFHLKANRFTENVYKLKFRSASRGDDIILIETKVAWLNTKEIILCQVNISNVFVSDNVSNNLKDICWILQIKRFKIIKVSISNPLLVCCMWGLSIWFLKLIVHVSCQSFFLLQFRIRRHKKWDKRVVE